MLLQMITETCPRSFLIGACCLMQIRWFPRYHPNPLYFLSSGLKLSRLTDAVSWRAMSVVLRGCARPCLPLLPPWPGGQWTMGEEGSHRKGLLGNQIRCFQLSTHVSVLGQPLPATWHLKTTHIYSLRVVGRLEVWCQRVGSTSRLRIPCRECLLVLWSLVVAGALGLVPESPNHCLHLQRPPPPCNFSFDSHSPLPPPFKDTCL